MFGLFEPGHWIELEWEGTPYHIRGLLLDTDWGNGEIKIWCEAAVLDGGFVVSEKKPRCDVVLEAAHVLDSRCRLTYVGKQGDGTADCLDCGRVLSFVRTALVCPRHGLVGGF